MTIAVVAEKSGTKETKTNKKFSVWTLSDLNQAEVSPNTPFVVILLELLLYFSDHV